jgi:hypothetical protein
MLEKTMERSSLDIGKKIILKCFNQNASMSLKIGFNIDTNDDVVHHFMNMESKHYYRYFIVDIHRY